MIGLGTSPSTASFVSARENTLASAFAQRVAADGGNLEDFVSLTQDLKALL
jgi:hypothetical protein